MRIAYRLREEYDNDQFLGGVLAAGDQDGIDVRAELDANDGVILVEDFEQHKIAVLDAYPPLVRDPDHDDAAAAGTPAPAPAGDVRTEPATGRPRTGASATPDATTTTSRVGDDADATTTTREA